MQVFAYFKCCFFQNITQADVVVDINFPQQGI